MATTKRKEILDEMEYRLGLINTIATTTRWRDTDTDPLDPENTPAINIRDSKGTIDHQVSNDEHRLSVTIDLITTNRINDDEARGLLGDIAAVLDLHSDWGGHADGTTIESHDLNINQEGDTITAGTIEITVNYTTDKGKL